MNKPILTLYPRPGMFLEFEHIHVLGFNVNCVGGALCRCYFGTKSPDAAHVLKVILIDILLKNYYERGE